MGIQFILLESYGLTTAAGAAGAVVAAVVALFSTDAFGTMQLSEKV